MWGVLAKLPECHEFRRVHSCPPWARADYGSGPPLRHVLRPGVPDPKTLPRKNPGSDGLSWVAPLFPTRLSTPAPTTVPLSSSSNPTTCLDLRLSEVWVPTSRRLNPSPIPALVGGERKEEKTGRKVTDVDRARPCHPSVPRFDEDLHSLAHAWNWVRMKRGLAGDVDRKWVDHTASRYLPCCPWGVTRRGWSPGRGSCDGGSRGPTCTCRTRVSHRLPVSPCLHGGLGKHRILSFSSRTWTQWVTCVC